MVHIHLLLLMSTLVSVQVINIAASLAAAGNGRAALRDLACGGRLRLLRTHGSSQMPVPGCHKSLGDPGEL